MKPDWAGDDLLSKVVDAAISNKILYEGLMKPMARRTLINTAEKNGVAWRDIADELGNEPGVKKAFAEIEDNRRAIGEATAQRLAELPESADDDDRSHTSELA